jgi:hypothetical protein
MWKTPGFLLENVHLFREKTPPEQSCPDSELCWSSLTTSAEMALRRGAPSEYSNHAGAMCSVQNPAPEGNPGLGHTQTSVIFKKVNQKIIFKGTFS